MQGSQRQGNGWGEAGRLGLLTGCEGENVRAESVVKAEIEKQGKQRRSEAGVLIVDVDGMRWGASVYSGEQTEESEGLEIKIE